MLDYIKNTTPEKFAVKVDEIYSDLYDGILRLDSPTNDEAQDRFDDMIKNGSQEEKEFFRQVVRARGDIFSSDRECAAYALAAGWVKPSLDVAAMFGCESALHG